MPTDVVARLHQRHEAPTSTLPSLAGRAPWLAARLHDAQITAEHLSALIVWLSAAPVITMVGWLVVGGWFGVGVGAVLVVSPVLFVAGRRGRRVAETVRLLPEVIDVLARSLRSGASMRGALRETTVEAPAAIAQEFQLIVAALDRGQPIELALQDWVQRSPIPQVRMVASALVVASSNQAGASQALDGVAQSLRDRVALSNDIASLTAQASASMQAMVGLPAGFLFIDSLGSQRTLRYLFEQRLGQACLVAGVVLNLCGLLWMRALVTRGSRS